MQRRRNLLTQQTSILPHEYRRVEYLESSGTQYLRIFNTRYRDTPFLIVCQAIQTNANGVIVGYSAIGGFYMSHNVGFYSLGGGANFTSVSLTDKITATIKWTSNNITVEINNQVLSRNISGTTTEPLTLFGAQNRDSWYGASVKIFSFSSPGIINLIPCVRKSDNKPGMYDTVSKTFYTNTGTGEFIVPEN